MTKKPNPKMPMEDLRYILRTLGLGKYVSRVKIHDGGSIAMALNSPIPKASLKTLKERYQVSADRHSMLIDPKP